jgi:hypothetical protein
MCRRKGGESASMAWPRLAEYFARFKLSLGMKCSVEVLAPTLSRVPLWVQPSNLCENRAGTASGRKAAVKTKKTLSGQNDQNWSDVFDDTSQEQTDSDSCSFGSQVSVPNKERVAIWKATQEFLGRRIDIANVAHARLPIRTNQNPTRRKAEDANQATGAILEVDVIVHGPYDDDDDSRHICREGGVSSDDSDDESEVEEKSERDTIQDGISSSASMVLVRMVNKIPLLDSAEAVACGLVQGISSKKRMWNSFGLDVNLKHDTTKVDKLPIFEVRDSEQVAPFFKTGAHQLFDTGGDAAASNDAAIQAASGKRKGPTDCRGLFPASVRLGNILVIAQIHAEPAMLPLPTLSKVEYSSVVSVASTAL